MEVANLLDNKINTLELHYFFRDNSHNMDAYVQNKCEFEFLGIIKEVAKAFDLDIYIETEPFDEGGLKRWFKVLVKSENKTATITVAVVVSVVTTILVTPLSTAISKTTEMWIENLFEDKEAKELEDEKTKLEIENLKLDIEIKRRQLNDSHAIAKKKSNFYDALDKYQKVTEVSISAQKENKTSVSDDRIVSRENFKQFILVSDKLDPIINESAEIEIISPVLKKGDYKWKGIYEGETVSFNMKSNEFKTLVQTGKIEFKNGSSIRCVLETERKIDNEGREEITNYNILRVNEYFENNKPKETPEGRFHRQKREADERQIKLFDNEI